MRPILRDLCGLLSEQKSVLERLLELAEEERRVIIAGESERLEDVVRQELRELSKLNAAEKKRIALHETISGELGLPVQEINVTEIAKRAEPDESKEIQKLQAELTGLIDKHSAINKENRELIKAHMEYSDVMLDLLVDSEDPLNNFYGGDGKAAPEKKKTTGFFDHKA